MLRSATVGVLAPEQQCMTLAAVGTFVRVSAVDVNMSAMIVENALVYSERDHSLD